MANQPQQGQASPFKGIKDREKRVFKIRKLDNSKTGQNVSYEVLLDEKPDGSIETIHLNRKFYSKAGYEITPTVITGICGACGDVTPSNFLKHCSCGRHLCPRCRRKIFGQYYCKWWCMFLIIIYFLLVKWYLKLIFLFVKMVYKLLIAVLRLIARIILIPFKDIYRG